MVQQTMKDVNVNISFDIPNEEIKKELINNLNKVIENDVALAVQKFVDDHMQIEILD